MRLAALLQTVDVIDVHDAARGPVDLESVEVRAVTRDSRKAGTGMAFVAIRGGRVDGHGFVAGLTGGVAVVEDDMDVPEGVVRVRVADTRRALAQLAASLEGHPARAVPVVGVTGTNGKTTITALCEGAMTALGRRGGRIGTMGAAWWDEERPTALTTPEAPELHALLRDMRADAVEAAFIEVSSIALDQRRVEALPFHTVVFTNLSRDHLDFHGTMEAYAAAKAQLFSEARLRAAGGPPRAVLCGDDPAWERMQPPEDRWLYGFEAHNDVRITELSLSTEGQRLTVEVPDRAAALVVETRLVGRFNALNAVAALVALHTVGLSWEEAAVGLSQVAGVRGRLERVPGPEAAHLPAVFVDYAHTPEALRSAVEALRPLASGEPGLTVVVGCGGDRDAGKRADMGRIAAEGADRAILTSDNPRSEDPDAILADMLDGVPEALRRADAESLPRVIVQPDRRAAIAAAVDALGGVVLIAGKGHETTQEIAGVRHPFDDVEVARESLEAQAERGLERAVRAAIVQRERSPARAWTAERIAAVTGGDVLQRGPAGDGALPATGTVLTDTRKDLTGAWFLAIVGPRFDGHAYLEVAADKGALGAVVSRIPDELSLRSHPDFGLVLVEDTTAAFADLGRDVARQLRLTGGGTGVPIVGITGSSGKTTTRALTACALSPLGRVHQTVGNLNNQFGVPMTLLATPDDADVLVVEMGTNAPGEIEHLAEIGLPTHRLIVNVGPAHLEELGGLDGVAVEKGAMFATARPGDTLLVNVDDERVRPWVERAPAGTRVLTWGRAEEAQVRLLDVALDGEALSTTARYRVALPGSEAVEVEATIPAFGLHFASNGAAALAIAVSLGADPAAAAAGLGHYAPVGMRQRVERLDDGPAAGTLVLNDAYNANPQSVKTALDTLAALGGTGAERGQGAVAALGDMLELGEHEASMHREVLEHALALGLDRVVLVGPRMAHAAAGLDDPRLHTFDDAESAGRTLPPHLGPGHRLLIKGSRGMAMERILQVLQEER